VLAAVEEARDGLAAAIGADPREIVWTSGATESNNLALKGVAGAAAYRKRTRIVTVATEHKAVLDPCHALEQAGYEVVTLGVDAEGLVDPDEIAAALDERTLLVSVMHANNEIGVLQPIERIGRLCKEAGVLFHTDATQALGREAIDVEACGIDLLSVSAHKLYGPKGVGALYVRRRGPRVRCEAILDGGGHERGMRSGTLNVPGIVGFGAAVRVAGDVLAAERERLRTLRDRLEGELMRRLEGVERNGHAARRLTNTSNLSFAGCDAQSLMTRAPELLVSTSSACTSARMQPSYVLAALGLSRERIEGSLRISLGRSTTADHVDRAVALLCAAVERERADGPLAVCRP